MKEEYGRSLQILFAVCGLVLLIACANVANLLLARAVARRGQTALRLAIGATRRQIIVQALTESVLLAIAGGVAGLLVAIAAARLLLALAFRGAHFLPISTSPSLPCAGVRLRIGADNGNHFWSGSRMVCDAHRSRRSIAWLVEPQHHRTLHLRAQSSADPAIQRLGRSRRGSHHAGAKPEQPRRSEFRISDQRSRPGFAAQPGIRSYATPISRALPSDRRPPQSAFPASEVPAWPSTIRSLTIGAR